MITIIWNLWSGEAVIDRRTSHIHDGISTELLKESLLHIQSNNESYIDQTIFHDRIIWKSLRIATVKWDEIIFVQRKNRKWPSRFVKNKQPIDYNGITIVLLKNKYHANEYVLMTAYIGDKAPPEPWDNPLFEKLENGEERRKEALEFWNNHALIWGYFDIIE